MNHIGTGFVFPSYERRDNMQRVKDIKVLSNSPGINRPITAWGFEPHNHSIITVTVAPFAQMEFTTITTFDI